MIFARKIYNELIQWKKANATAAPYEKKAILIEGARRVGKSTIATTFAAAEYRTYCLIDFSKNNNGIRNCFENNLNNLDEFFEKLLAFSENKAHLYPNESVIIFDEIQEYPYARKCLDILVKDGRYDYIETGSLVSVKLKAAEIKVPAMEHAIKMYPMDYEEFCTALNQTNIIEDIRLHFKNKTKLDEKKHREAMHLLREYMLTGGMPQAVLAFVNSGKDTKNFKPVDTVKKEILNIYRNDLTKCPVSDIESVITVFDNIRGLLSQHERSTQKYGAAFIWLNEAMICNIYYKCNDPSVDLASNKNDAYAKCYMGDTGLLLSLTYDDKTITENDLYNKILNDKLHTNDGMLYENVVSQMLVSAGHSGLYYYSQTKTRENPENPEMEIEFLISRLSNQNYRVCPIEVKSETGYQTKSLIEFKTKFKEKIGTGIVILPDNLHIDRNNDILYMPPYMTFCL
ncbi:MAG: AAA family ATPase [Clostridia bacterium]|nr:AAA family ATPase [Clostridia bacterium]